MEKGEQDDAEADEAGLILILIRVQSVFHPRPMES
jgi:hypothetical protein